MLYIENMRTELENLIMVKGIGHLEVLRLSERLDKYISIYYFEK